MSSKRRGAGAKLYKGSKIIYLQRVINPKCQEIVVHEESQTNPTVNTKPHILQQDFSLHLYLSRLPFDGASPQWLACSAALLPVMITTSSSLVNSRNQGGAHVHNLRWDEKISHQEKVHENQNLHPK